MALVLLAGAGYAYYQQQEARFRVDEGIDLEDPSVQSIEFLPAEVTSTILQSTLSTITFYEGASYETVKSQLEARIDAIRKANPWLGGIVAQRRSDAAPRLFYGPATSAETPSSFQTFDLGEIPFTSSTPYHQYEDILRDYQLKVPTLPTLMGSNRHPLWKVTLLPDASDPDHQFAMIVSMAHVLGDAHTFYQLYHMLADLDEDDHDNVVEELNPQRIPEFQQEVQERLGNNESTFFKTSNPAIWERGSNSGSNTTDNKKGPGQPSQQRRHKEHELMLFTIRPEWVKEQKQNLLDVAAAAAAAPSTSSDTEEEKDKEHLERIHSLSHESIMVSWFFRDICQPTVGLVSKSNLRNFCACLGELDAGNYLTPIPLVGPVDYDSPVVVQQALGTGKRSGVIMVDSPPAAAAVAASTAPAAAAAVATTAPAAAVAAATEVPAAVAAAATEGSSPSASLQQQLHSELPARILMAGPNVNFGLGVDWTRLLPQGELRLWKKNNNKNMTDSTSTSLKQGWHWPLHDTLDLDCIPPRASVLTLFQAKNGTMGALCIVSSRNDKEMSQRIIGSGIIQETIAVV